MIPSIFIPIDLEASLGKIEDSNERKRKASHDQPSSPSSQQESGATDDDQSPRSKILRTGVTRTSSRTPFVMETGDETEKSGNCNSLLKPYPISESDTEIRERKRLSEAVDWSNGLVVNSPPTTSINPSASENADQQSMMEVTVDDFILSPEEAQSVTDLDATTIQDDDFWETPVQVANTLSMNGPDAGIMASVPFSVTFSNQDPCIGDLDNEDELTDAAPIRSVDMEW